jgi:alginate O-acetyltransferase complex protein AlgI
LVFSSIPFLFIFLPIVLFGYFIVPKGLKNLFLFIFSLIFYAWGEPIYVFLMLFSALADYIFGICIEKTEHRKKLFLICSITVNLLVLGTFKYLNFIFPFIDYELPLPIGISFYTFQTMSYTIDVYRGKVKAQCNFIDFGLFVSLFPQLTAGPIVKYATIEKELRNRKVTTDLFASGVRKFTCGLGKKVLIANNIGMLWNTVKESSEVSFSLAVLGLLAFSFQIYFDFSGYSDMAIGLGRMFGFKFLENFDYPYISKSITEFWRRWHMSLGQWFREYVYIPLGGNRRGTAVQIRNIFIVWFLTGIWHGASWNFVIWGLYFGVLLFVEKITNLKYTNRFLTIVLVVFGWYIFEFEDIKFGISGFYDGDTLYYLSSYAVVFAICVVGSTPLLKRVYKRISLLEPVYVMGVLILSTAYLLNSEYNPFLYFRF